MFPLLLLLKCVCVQLRKILASVFHASVLLLIMNFVITMPKKLGILKAIAASGWAAYMYPQAKLQLKSLIAYCPMTFKVRKKLNNKVPINALSMTYSNDIDIVSVFLPLHT